MSNSKIVDKELHYLPFAASVCRILFGVAVIVHRNGALYRLYSQRRDSLEVGNIPSQKRAARE
jgi:hypothetical protein